MTIDDIDMNKVDFLRQQGFGIRESINALTLFENKLGYALQYLLLKGDAVARKNKDGQPWSQEDYIKYVKGEEV